MNYLLKHTEIDYVPNFLSPKEASILFSQLMELDLWEQREFKIFGKTILNPRLEFFCADSSEITYGYSGSKLQTLPFPDCLKPLIEKLKQNGLCFNSALVNLYRNERDSNGWHQDNEKELGADPVIYSISLGAKRKFQLKSNDKKEKLDLFLEDGSLLVMRKGSQLYYKHQLPKLTKFVNPRINITFRNIICT